MKWKELLAGTVVALTATTCLAETPQWSSGRPAVAPILSPGRLFGGQTWWTRYGEPVNSAALEDAPAKAAAEYVGPEHGNGYAYGPGSCDCQPPCVDHLWAGYQQSPCRCHNGLFHRLCVGACGGNYCGTNSGGCGPACSTKAACGCGEPVTCAKPVADCGCTTSACTTCRSTPILNKCRGFLAHWSHSCDSCSAPLGCGCSTPVGEASPSDQPQPSADKQSVLRPPMPILDVSYPRPR